MKIEHHPRLRDVAIGDEVYNSVRHIVARVEDVFPAAVCVKVPILTLHGYFELLIAPQLWRADQIKNLSVCHYCGTRDDLLTDAGPGAPLRICPACRTRATACSLPHEE